jgi:hypothetical protein
VTARRFAIWLVAPWLVAAWAASAFAQGPPTYRVRITNNNLVGLTTTNYAFFGNNFTSRSPSFEYPLGTGFEHMVRGGLWIGGLGGLPDSADALRVSTGAVDGSQGSASAAGTEFTPAGSAIVERSRLPNSKFFDPSAVSEQDFSGDFNDFPPKPSVTVGEDHVPLGVRVHQETYSWSFAKFKNFIAVHLEITNLSRPLRNAWVGMYAEMASGPKNANSGWPPSSTCSTLGAWYNKKLLRYDSERRLIAEHYCRLAPSVSDTSACDDAVCPPWVGIQLLGIRPDTVANKQVTLYIANYSPGDTTRDEDFERHSLMSTGRITPPDSLLPGGSASGRPNDPVELLAVGPFQSIPSDSTIEVDFAYVAGTSYQDLLENAAFAQLAFDFNYVIPTPPPSPRLAVVPRDRGLDLYWDRSPEETSDPTSPAPGGKDFEGYRIYLGTDRNAMNLVAQFDRVDTTGFNTGFEAVALPDSVLIEGVWYHYRYRIENLKTGFRHFVAVTSYDTGDQQIESLESGITQNQARVVPAPSTEEARGRQVVVFPNPYKAEAQWDAGRLVRDHYLWFANLPRQCTIKIYTLAGDLVKEVEFDGDTYQGAGARGLYNPATEIDVNPPRLSGTVYAWDLITSQGQAVASGLYLFAVRDRATGETQRGKFLVVKSDREGFQ